MIAMAIPVLAVEVTQKTKATDSIILTQQSAENHALAHKMMGHINLAQLALDLNMLDQASDQLEQARDIKTTLVKKMPNLIINSSFNYGKVTHDRISKLTEHYIPIVDDVFLVSHYEEIFERGKAVDINETSAGVVYIGISVDLRKIETVLDNALAAIDEKDANKAKTVLIDVFKGAIYNEEEIDDPVLAISDNLALAKLFLNDGRYDSARLTLKHVQDRLDTTRKTDFLAVDKELVDQFSADLKDFQERLHKKDATLTQRISDRLTSWGRRVKGWF